MQRVGLQGGKGYDPTGNREGAGSQGHDASPDCQVNWCNAVIDMAYRRGDNDRPEVLGHGFIEATTWGEGMSGDHNMHQKPRSYLDDFECPRCGHCCPQQTEQEPVAWRYKYPDGFWRFSNGERVNGSDSIKSQALYTTPPKREWVGLTLNEAEDFYEKYTDRAELINAIDKFLEEKNA